MCCETASKVALSIGFTARPQLLFVTHDGIRFGLNDRIGKHDGLVDTGRVSVGQSMSKKETRMTDPTDSIRREMVAEINAEPGSRVALETKHGQVWDTTELQRDFEALGFMAPLIIVRRRSDGVRGSLMFQHNPRFYFGFQPE